MRLENYSYKPKCITQLDYKDFCEEGIAFEDILQKMVSSKYDSIFEIPEDQSLNVRTSYMERHCVRLASFHFLLGSSYGDFVRPTVDMKFPYKEVYDRGEADLDRDPSNIHRARSFPNSVDYLGYTLGNFHLNVVIKDLFEEHTSHSINFDEDGNYLPIVSTENYSSPCEHLWTLKYTAEDWVNPIDLDKMLIPELCNAKIGKYFFWLDRFHFAKIYDTNKAYGSSNSNYLKVIELFSMNCYDEKRTWDKNFPDCEQLVKKVAELGPFYYPRNAVRYFQSVKDIYLCDDGNYMYGKTHQSTDNIGNMATIRRLATPLERKALELYEILNSDPSRFAKQVVFPDSIRKVAEAISPLVVKAVQIVRTCKSMQLEEI